MIENWSYSERVVRLRLTVKNNYRASPNIRGFPCAITLFSENPRKFMKYNRNINKISERQNKAVSYTTMCHMKTNEYTLLTQTFHNAYDFFIPNF